MRSRPSSETLDGVGGLLDYLPMPAFLVDTRHEIVVHNQRFQDAFGEGRSLAGSRCHATIHHVSVPCHRRGESCPVRSCFGSSPAARAVHVHRTSCGLLPQQVSAFSVLEVSTAAPLGLAVLLPATRAIPMSPWCWPNRRSRAFVEFTALIRAAALTDVPVLLLGEPGSGKERVARAIHRLSARHRRPFLRFDVSALQALEAWDAAAGRHDLPVAALPTVAALLPGLLAGGTLFLHEVDRLAPRSQSSLRAHIDSWLAGIQRSGDQRREVARLICGSSSDLWEAVVAGRFRRDLYHRIAAFSVRLPPLSERSESVPDEI